MPPPGHYVAAILGQAVVARGTAFPRLRRLRVAKARIGGITRSDWTPNAATQCLVVTAEAVDAAMSCWLPDHVLVSRPFDKLDAALELTAAVLTRGAAFARWGDGVGTERSRTFHSAAVHVSIATCYGARDDDNQHL